MNILTTLVEKTQEAITQLYGLSDTNISFEQTNSKFDGDLTFVVFPYLKHSKKRPEDTAKEIGDYIFNKMKAIKSFNVVKGFLNIEFSDDYWLNVLQSRIDHGIQIPEIGVNKKIVVEYSSPNTNKPLHLGHIRNNVLGFSICQIFDAVGYDVVKNNLVNDRGIHICKSMVAYEKWGNNETPQSAGLKGDHLIGKYYVMFDQYYQKEVKDLISKGVDKDEAKEKSSLMMETRNMLQKWENGDQEVFTLWTKLNNWVYEGFESTYNRLGVNFDKIYYESNTYLLGKEIVQEGLDSGIFFKKEDGSIWIDLTPEGLDEKIVQRSDGTSVYITQDIGTADLKYQEFKMDKFVYVVGNEQDYHFKVLQLILKRLGKSYADGLYHLSYGMVDLPEGKMKSREGTVVDADELMDKVVATAKKQTEELGKTDGMSSKELDELYEVLGLGALKYYLLKVDAKKRMMYDPKESIDFQGNTAPFIQYTYTRIASLLRAADKVNFSLPITFHSIEKELIKQLNAYPEVITSAANNYNPSEVANAIYDLAKTFNKFYHELTILGELDSNTRSFRISLSKTVGETIKHGFGLLGIQVPERM
ncbi:MAG: arginine--tRNA ligase [Bacteroidia bacterium]|nr:arginine--tRNA ligase [Bacteroidia bacterium]MDG2042133.1 arginine--tRNA ligase [Bacteroidia bacterium]|tara:strand:- start:4994 stop:6757 length:1764 start_codon:yes stop_codon:yes gene_type:complete